MFPIYKTKPRGFPLKNKLKAYKAKQKVRSVSLADTDAYAVIQYQNGKSSKSEFQFGNSYLSQSSRKLFISPEVKAITIYSVAGSKRELTFDDHK